MVVTTRFPATDVGGGLAPWARVFARYPGPRIIAAALLVMTAARVALWRWHWWDLLIVGAFIAAQPFTEWLIHVFVLHIPPESLVQCAQPHLPAHQHPAIGGLLDAGLDGFQRIVHFPDEFFDNVFQGH